MAANKKIGTGPDCREHGTRYMTGLKSILTPKTVRAYAAKAMTFEEIANLYGYHRQSAMTAIKTDESLLDAWQEGHAQLLKTVTGALLERINNGCVVSILFTLKSKFGWVEEQYRKQDTGVPILQAQVYLPGNNR